MTFQRATKTQARLRMALIGPSGSGKTYTSLRLARGLGEKVALIDTERGSAAKYADEFEFDVLELDSFNPQVYIQGIRAAEEAGYDVLIIDSLSHAWAGKGGLLEFVDEAKARHRGSSFSAWREATPLHNQLIDAMIGSRLHLLVTMRSKMEYVQEQNEQGKTVIRKVGMQPVQRDGLEYEFDVVGDLDQDNRLLVSKTRCSSLRRAVIAEPGEELAATLRAWLTSGAPAPTPAPSAPASSGEGSGDARGGQPAPAADAAPAPEPRPEETPKPEGDLPKEAAQARVTRMKNLALEKGAVKDEEEVERIIANHVTTTRLGYVDSPWVEGQIKMLEGMKPAEPKQEALA